MKRILKALAAGFSSVFLATGVLVGAQSGMIDTTGPDSQNEIKFENKYKYEVENDTDVDADVKIDQDADTGNAWVKHNTSGGDAETGDAENDSNVEATLEVDNSSSSAAGVCGCDMGDSEASIEMTGPDSHNLVKFNNDTKIEIKNKTDLDFDVDVDQDADSGDAKVWGNTTGGSATTGSASNTSSVVLNFSVTN